MLYKNMSRDRPDEAIGVMQDFRISNDMFKEHLLDLCMNKKVNEQFENLTTN